MKLSVPDKNGVLREPAYQLPPSPALAASRSIPVSSNTITAYLTSEGGRDCPLGVSMIREKDANCKRLHHLTLINPERGKKQRERVRQEPATF